MDHSIRVAVVGGHWHLVLHVDELAGLGRFDDA